MAVRDQDDFSKLAVSEEKRNNRNKTGTLSFLLRPASPSF
jgi:hypothetical protein